MIRRNTLLFMIIIGICSCKNIKRDAIKEGIIEYNVHYLNKEKESLYSFFLPKKMIIKFKKDKTKSELNGFSGNFYFSLIANSRTDSAIALFKIMNHDYYYVETQAGPSELFGNLPGMKINYTNDLCSIAGYECVTAEIESMLDSFPPFDICYTKNINIHNPNKKNPFHEINGVLLDFSVNLYNMDMRFVADKILDTTISDSEFFVPEGFKRINKTNVDQIMSLLD